MSTRPLYFLFHKCTGINRGSCIECMHCIRFRFVNRNPLSDTWWLETCSIIITCNHYQLCQSIRHIIPSSVGRTALCSPSTPCFDERPLAQRRRAVTARMRIAMPFLVTWHDISLYEYWRTCGLYRKRGAISIKGSGLCLYTRGGAIEASS